MYGFVPIGSVPTLALEWRFPMAALQCPQCRSTNVHLVEDVSRDLHVEIYRCHECDRVWWVEQKRRPPETTPRHRID